MNLLPNLQLEESRMTSKKDSVPEVLPWYVDREVDKVERKNRSPGVLRNPPKRRRVNKTRINEEGVETDDDDEGYMVVRIGEQVQDEEEGQGRYVKDDQAQKGTVDEAEVRVQEAQGHDDEYDEGRSVGDSQVYKVLWSINQRAEQLLHFHACLLFKLRRSDREGYRETEKGYSWPFTGTRQE